MPNAPLLDVYVLQRVELLREDDYGQVCPIGLLSEQFLRFMRIHDTHQYILLSERKFASPALVRMGVLTFLPTLVHSLGPTFR